MEVTELGGCSDAWTKDRSLPGGLRKGIVKRHLGRDRKDTGHWGIKKGRFRKPNVKIRIKKKEGRGRVFEDKNVRDTRGLGTERNSLWN